MRESAGEHLATACLPLNQGVIQGVRGGHEEVQGWRGKDRFHQDGVGKGD